MVNQLDPGLTMLGRYLEMLQSNQASILDLIIQRTVLRAQESMNIAK